MSGRAVVRWASVLSGCCLLGLFPRVSVRRAIVREAAKTPSTTKIWNSLVPGCFHLTYSLHSFNTIVSREPASLPPGFFSRFQKLYPCGNLTLNSK